MTDRPAEGGLLRVIIDCDPGLDDAVALLLAVASDRVVLDAVTTVAGNVEVAKTTENARRILALAGSPAPVFAGCPGPLVVAPRFAPHIHGPTGLRDVALSDAGPPVGTRHAADHLASVLEAAPDRSATLCMVGPLTNLAVVLIQKPDLARKVRLLVIMGGAVALGNATPAAEFNLFFDPHAADRVFKADIPTVLVPLDVTETVVMDRWRLRALTERAAADPRARLALAIMDRAHPNPRW